jgi:glutamine synthetase
MMPEAGVPLDSIQVEQGGGMFELPIEEADALVAADRAVLLKVGVKEICHKHGLLATFMSKIDQQYEGLSGAVHHSVIDNRGKNLFADKKRKNGLSRFLESWCEGLLRNLLDISLIFLPNSNSYKRPVPGWFVGNSTTWAVESRATTLRVINYHPPSTRIENRLPGADCNPYLVIAAHLAAGMDGVDNKLTLRPPFTEGDPAMVQSDRDDVDYIPLSFESAVDRFKKSKRMAECFGPLFHSTFVAHREHELELTRTFVADWERQRLLENI